MDEKSGGELVQQLVLLSVVWKVVEKVHDTAHYWAFALA
jgi:hypothetical protein